MVKDDERQPLLGDSSRQQELLGYGIDAEKLTKLIDPKNPKLLRELGGVERICNLLRVDPSIGLSADEDRERSSSIPFIKRQQVFGRNILPQAISKSFLQLLWAAYNDKTLIMLTIASIVSLAIGIWEDWSPSHNPDDPRVGWVEGTAILVAVFTVILTNAINDYEKEKQFKKLNAKKEDRLVKVIRNGHEHEISVYDLQVGDILILEPGDILPVDGLFLDGHNVACDESSATGESDTMKKKAFPKNDDGNDNSIDCFLLSGSKVLEGVGRCVVIAVGEHSFFGKTMMSMRGQETEGTPLQVKLDILAEQIAKLGFAAALLMLLTLIIKYLVLSSLENHWPSSEQMAATLVRIIIQAITIIVVAVPEGLPMAVTMALAFATTQMLKENNLVRVLSACETMGNATAICSDKTGTLTQNVMSVEKGTMPAYISFDNQEQGSIKQWRSKCNDEKLVETIVQGIAINSTAFENNDENGQRSFIGSKTECALLSWAKQLGCDYEQIRHDLNVVQVYPFASKRKTMSTVISNNITGKGYRMYTKGASEIVLDHCTQYIDQHGKPHRLDKEGIVKWQGIISDYANQALRTIALAYKDMKTSENLNKAKGNHGNKDNDNDDNDDDEEEPDLDNLILIGVVGIMDPLRPGVVESVQTFRQAGVFIRMITGDNIDTAKAIARKAGILTKGGVAITGPELRNMSVEEQRKVIPRLQVLARSSPTDKTVVVTRLQEQDQVVGMTGDGTNDGPALKMADVGFAMGITGTEVSKEASDIILMDDNFNSILKALLWGRGVNDGVRKFLTFQLTVNVAAVVLSFVSALTSDTSESILSAVQLLWVNLIMDTLAALALATEPPSHDLLQRKPISKYAHLINFPMAKMIIGQAIFQIAINLALLYSGYALFHLDPAHDEKVLRTMLFNVFVFLQIFNELNCRRIDNTTLNVFSNIHRHWIFILVQIFVIFGQYLIVTFGGIAFKTVPLTASQWCITILLGSLSLPIGTIIRLLPDCCGCERRFNEDATPLASYSRMHWEGAIGDIRKEVRILSLLRRSNHHHHHSRSNSNTSISSNTYHNHNHHRRTNSLNTQPTILPSHRQQRQNLTSSPIPPELPPRPTTYGTTTASNDISSGTSSGGNRFANLVNNAKQYQLAAEQANQRQQQKSSKK
ncbi:PMCA-type calcium-translocating P-type ATPase [Halteromyces radiatus]|uniref:PMCA-type calcium-translocating P-type ATPase n=1 Tax=Halteromyces radiatus TaxID=101107 RepID=UPI00221EF75D|nr:PMCA-type calcium-translocating P-type ATPase [Halteromyces radiatus]KAI8078906.1 PMCA-type calcium-translocating P-type ATPase [Halteromyces radiatus]